MRAEGEASWNPAGRAGEGSSPPTPNSAVVNLHLPAPWGAPERDLRCERCARTTRHYGRRVTAIAGDDSDRAAGEVVWFCTICGHRHDAANGSVAPQEAVAKRPDGGGEQPKHHDRKGDKRQQAASPSLQVVVPVRDEVEHLASARHDAGLREEQ